MGTYVLTSRLLPNFRSALSVSDVLEDPSLSADAGLVAFGAAAATVADTPCCSWPFSVISVDADRDFLFRSLLLRGLNSPSSSAQDRRDSLAPGYDDDADGADGATATVS